MDKDKTWYEIHFDTKEENAHGEIKRPKTHRIEKYAAPQHTYQAGLHGSGTCRPTGVFSVHVNPYAGPGLALNVKAWAVPTALTGLWSLAALF